MVQIIPSAQRHHADFGWLSTRWHFSFDRYYDPNNVKWGALRVFNDDVVQPSQGFGTHGHRDMEIVSVVLDGALAHTDSIGSKQVLRPGEVQVMSAGSGIMHSEFNPSATDPVHFLQLWITPRTQGAKPRWEQRAFEGREGKLLPVVSSGSIPGTLTIDQDASIFLSKLDPEQSVEHTSATGRKAYLFVTTGELEVNGKKVGQGDQARVDNEPSLQIRATAASEFILLDLPNN